MPMPPALIIHPDAAVTLWTARDDRPGQWVAATLEVYAGLWSPSTGRRRLGEEYGCLLRSPFGYGLVQLTPSDLAPGKMVGELPAGQSADLIVPLGAWLMFWCKPEAGKKWFTRSFMSNANSQGFFLTAGQGGRGVRGKVRLGAMGDQTPPDTAMPVEALRRSPPPASE